MEDLPDLDGVTSVDGLFVLVEKSLEEGLEVFHIGEGFLVLGDLVGDALEGRRLGLQLLLKELWNLL